jgi:hypothetical protein
LLRGSNCHIRPKVINWEYLLNGVTWTAVDEDTECVDVVVGIIPQLALFRVEFECGECEVKSEIFVFNEGCDNSETRNVKEDYFVNVFPNPTENILKIISSEEFSFGSIIQIFTMKGRLVMKEDFNRRIDIKNLQLGTYMLQITNENKTAHAKFVKI